MLILLLYGAVLPACVLSSTYNLQAPSLDVKSHFPTEEELRATAKKIKRDVSGNIGELVELRETGSRDDLKLQLRSTKRTVSVQLKQSTRLISPLARAKIIDGENEYETLINPELRNAMYHGSVEGDERAHVALGKTQRGWTGHVSTKGQIYRLHRIPASNENSYMLIKLKDKDKVELDSFQQQINKRAETKVEAASRMEDPEFEMEVGLFADKGLYDYVAQKFPAFNTMKSVEEILLLAINTIHTILQKPSLGKQITLVIMRMEVMKTNHQYLKTDLKLSKYWTNFCEWDAKYRNSRGKNYDVALMFTGMDVYGENELDKGALGKSALGMGCRHDKKLSCAIGDAKGYGVAMFLTREIGRLFGMKPDGDDNSCSETGYIMSKDISPAATTFSSCSKDYLNKYFTILDDFGLNCLRDNTDSLIEHVVSGLLPGEWLADQPGLQCSFQLGPGWLEDTSDDAFCEALMCVKGDDVQLANIGAVPLPGTHCGKLGEEQQVCWNGKCQNRTIVFSEIETFHAETTKPKKISLTKLCTKYGKKSFPKAVQYKKLSKKKKKKKKTAKKLKSICDKGMICKHKKKNTSMKLPYPAPPGTSCGKKKKCKNFKCQ